MRSKACVGCGGELPPAAKMDLRRKWCSERCRKQTLYGGVCEACGGPTNGSDSITGQPRFCAGCGSVISGEASRLRAKPQRELVERMWAEGASSREIAEATGSTSKDPSMYVARLRGRGYDLPVRNVGASRANAARATHFGRLA